MQIASFVRDSFQEFEDHHSLVLFCKGCNFSCPECYNLKSLEQPPIGTAVNIIKAEITPMHDAVVFLGGEPTIWSNGLLKAAVFAKRSMDLSVKVFTNGFQPDVVERLIAAEVVDAFSVDFKCLEAVKEVIGVDISAEKYISTVTDTINIIRDSNIPIELRTTSFKSVRNMDLLKSHVGNTFPNVRHIIQEDFSPMLENVL